MMLVIRNFIMMIFEYGVRFDFLHIKDDETVFVKIQLIHPSRNSASHHDGSFFAVRFVYLF